MTTITFDPLGSFFRLLFYFVAGVILITSGFTLTQAIVILVAILLSHVDFEGRHKMKFEV